MNTNLPDRQSILVEIEQAGKRLAILRSEQKEVELTVQSLKAHLAHNTNENSSDPTKPIVSSSTLTPGEIIILFHRLFRGREDVYPKLWINRKTGKKGYSPACAKEWTPGVCEKPRVKCGECTKQSLLPVTNDTVLDHLQGRHVIGVYPMLQDETCWFLRQTSTNRSGKRM